MEPFVFLWLASPGGLIFIFLRQTQTCEYNSGTSQTLIRKASGMISKPKLGLRLHPAKGLISALPTLSSSPDPKLSSRVLKGGVV